MSSYGDRAEALFHEGYNCAQSVLLAFQAVTGLDDDTAARLASPFGAGMGQLRETCGAFTGALLVVGALEGSGTPPDREARQRVYAMVREAAEQFQQENGSLVCGELLGLRLPPDGKPLPKKRPCAQLARTAAEIAAAVLQLP